MRARSRAAYAELSHPARFRDALEELGGLYAAFARYLAWRADLLRTDYLGRLRQVRLTVPPIDTAEASRILSEELGDPGRALAGRLEHEPCWSTLARCAWKAQHEGRSIAVQIARDPIPDSAFGDFERRVGSLAGAELEAVVQPATLRQFREWMRLSDSPGRERSYLEALAQVRDRSATRYPTVVPELSTERVLALEWFEGETLAALLAKGDARAVRLAAETVLEQVCLSSTIDGDFDPESIVLTSGGKLAVRRAERLIAVPPTLAAACLKYVSAVLAANAPSAAHLLVKLASGRTDLSLEGRLLDELSNLEPELKVNLRFPLTASVLEGNWRALANSGIERPLFLNAMHRNLIATGYWNAETASGNGPPDDFLAVAQWPVLGRVLRTRLGDLLTRDVASDWFIGSGLLFFESFRQMGRVAEQLRDNELSVGVDLQSQDGENHRLERKIRSGVIIAMLLIVFLVSLRAATEREAAVSAAFAALSVLAGLALFWYVSRVE